MTERSLTITWALPLAYGATALAALPLATGLAMAEALCLAPALIWLSLTDLDRQEIPDGACLTIALTGLGFQWFAEPATTDLSVTLLNALILLLLFWAVGEYHFRRTGEEGLGIGDAKLIAAAAVSTGPVGIWFLLLIAALGAIAALLLARHRGTTGQGSGIPFGPFLGYALFIQTLLAPGGAA